MNAITKRIGQQTRGIGFTLIELLIVMAIIATLLSVVVPQYFSSIGRAKEAALRTNLRIFREAIDKYKADTGTLPDSLQRLADAHYLRSVPVDPVTESTMTWMLVPAPDGITAGVYDVRSGSTDLASDGSPYSTW